MNKKIGSIFAAVLVAGLLCGCGKAEDDGAAKPLKDVDVDKYVTLGEYKGLPVNVEAISVSDEDVESLMNAAYSNYVTADNGGITDRAVEEGDTVNIDYEGKKDGVAFDGGTAQSQSLTIGSHTFIDGFEDGLIGVMPGETVDLDLTFPENYSQPDLAGAAVVFTVTVNFIVPTDMQDEVIVAMGMDGVETVEDFRQSAYDYLYSNAESNYNSQLQSAVLEAFMNSCEFRELPKGMYEKYETLMRDNLTQNAENSGLDTETYAQNYFQKDFESLVAYYTEESLKQDLALQAVANKEDLNIDDDMLNTTLQEYATQAGYDTVEEFIGDNSLEDYREYLVCNSALDFLMQNAAVSNE